MHTTDTTSNAAITLKVINTIITNSPASSNTITTDIITNIIANIINIAHDTQIAHVTLTLRNLTTQITHIIARSRLGSRLHACGV